MPNLSWRIVFIVIKYAEVGTIYAKIIYEYGEKYNRPMIL